MSSNPTSRQLGTVAETVSINSTLTQVVAPTHGGVGAVLYLRRTNTDVSQTYSEQFEASEDGNPPWSPLPDQQFQNMQPGETRIRTVSLDRMPFVRSEGVASGSGLSITATSIMWYEGPP